MSVQLYGCTTCTLTKHPKKNLDGNYTKMLSAVYGHLASIEQNIQVRRASI